MLEYFFVQTATDMKALQLLLVCSFTITMATTPCPFGNNTSACKEWENEVRMSQLEAKIEFLLQKVAALKTCDVGRKKGLKGLTLQELKFEGGKPSASSIYDTTTNYIPSHAFQQAPTRFWQSGRDEKGQGELAIPFPHAIWYEFSKPVIPGKVSFRPSPREGSAGNGFIGATDYQFVGSNDWPCSRYSRWTVLCEDLSNKLFERRTQSKYCTVDLHRRREAFRCLGINVLGSGYDKYPTVELTGIRMWKMA